MPARSPVASVVACAIGTCWLLAPAISRADQALTAADRAHSDEPQRSDAWYRHVLGLSEYKEMRGPVSTEADGLLTGQAVQARGQMPIEEVFGIVPGASADPETRTAMSRRAAEALMELESTAVRGLTIARAELLPSGRWVVGVPQRATSDTHRAAAAAFTEPSTPLPLDHPPKAPAVELAPGRAGVNAPVSGRAEHSLALQDADELGPATARLGNVERVDGVTDGADRERVITQRTLGLSDDTAFTLTATGGKPGLSMLARSQFNALTEEVELFLLTRNLSTTDRVVNTVEAFLQSRVQVTLAINDRDAPCCPAKASVQREVEVREPAHGEDPTSPFRTAAVPTDQLDTIRGGFLTNSGLQLSFGIERAVYIDGALVSTTVLRAGAVVAGQPPTSAGQTPSFGIIQGGPGNAVSAALSAASFGTVIQNSLNGQRIQTHTEINATTNSMQVLRSLNLTRSIGEALVQSLRP